MEINLWTQIFPQIISLTIALGFLWRLLGMINGNIRYKRIGIAITAVAYGKVALMMSVANPEIAKMYIMASLVLYFLAIANELLHMNEASSKVAILFNIFILSVLALGFDPTVPSELQSIGVVLAQIIVIGLVITSKPFAGRLLWLAAFSIFLVIHIYISRYSLRVEWVRIMYAWVEIPAQLLFLVGSLQYIKELNK